MQLHLEKCIPKPQFKSGLARYLFDALKSRNENIFKNPFMSCALYLDPRYRNAITSNHEKVDEAKTTLMKIWRRINAINVTPAIVEEANVSSDLSVDDFDESEAVFQLYNPTDPNEETPVDIETKIELFQPNSTTISPVLQYWESMKNFEPELYKLAMVIYAVPPTEVQIERDFSDLKWIFTDRRYNLSQSRLEAILLLHLNKDLFYKVNEKQIRMLQVTEK